MKREAAPAHRQPRRLRRHLHRGRPRLPDRALGDEGRVLPRRRHEVGHLPRRRRRSLTGTTIRRRPGPPTADARRGPDDRAAGRRGRLRQTALLKEPRTAARRGGSTRPKVREDRRRKARRPTTQPERSPASRRRPADPSRFLAWGVHLYTAIGPGPGGGDRRPAGAGRRRGVPLVVRPDGRRHVRRRHRRHPRAGRSGSRR